MKGTVYKLYNSNYPEFYIGSTTNFKRRKKDHKSACNNESTKEYNERKYKYIREHGGFDSWKFKILEQGEYEDKKSMEKRERYFIEILNSTLNTIIPGRTDLEYRESHREEANERTKKYYKENFPKVQEYKKKYQQKHKKKLNAYGRANYQENKGNRREHSKKYREDNKEKLDVWQKTEVICEFCKDVSSNRNIRRHQKTQKCLVAQIFHFHFE